MDRRKRTHTRSVQNVGYKPRLAADKLWDRTDHEANPDSDPDTGPADAE